MHGPNVTRCTAAHPAEVIFPSSGRLTMRMCRLRVAAACSCNTEVMYQRTDDRLRQLMHAGGCSMQWG
jgi:hypothetical protein